MILSSILTYLHTNWKKLKDTSGTSARTAFPNTLQYVNILSQGILKALQSLQVKQLVKNHLLHLSGPWILMLGAILTLEREAFTGSSVMWDNSFSWWSCPNLDKWSQFKFALIWRLKCESLRTSFTSGEGFPPSVISSFCTNRAENEGQLPLHT